MYYAWWHEVYVFLRFLKNELYIEPETYEEIGHCMDMLKKIALDADDERDAKNDNET